MTVVIPSLPQPTTVAAVLAASTASDVVGRMDDGSIGVFGLRAPICRDDAGIDELFLPRLQGALRRSAALPGGVDLRIWFRSVHRWASEIGDSESLIDALFAASARVVGVGQPGYAVSPPAHGGQTDGAMRSP